MWSCLRTHGLSVVCSELSSKVLAWALSIPVISPTALRGNNQLPVCQAYWGWGCCSTQQRYAHTQNNSGCLQFKHSPPRISLILLMYSISTYLVIPNGKSSHTRPTKPYSPSSSAPLSFLGPLISLHLSQAGSPSIRPEAQYAHRYALNKSICKSLLAMPEIHRINDAEQVRQLMEN